MVDRGTKEKIETIVTKGKREYFAIFTNYKSQTYLCKLPNLFWHLLQSLKEYLGVEIYNWFMNINH